jgi:putative ABC transport system permease protein
MLTAPGLRMPLRFLRGGYMWLLLTIVALASGVALVAASDLVNRAVLRAFVEIIDTMAGRAALQVSAGEGALFPEEVAERVRAVPGVEIAVPVLEATAFVADESGELITIQGVDIAREEAVRVYEAQDAKGLAIDDPLFFLAQPDSIVLTRAFATRRKLGLEDAITLETPTGRRRFVIRGLLEPTGVARAYGGNLAVMDLWAAEEAFARAGFVTRVDVVAAHDEDPEHLSSAIASVLPPGLRVQPPVQRKDDLTRIVRSLQLMLQGVSLVALVAAFLIAFNRLATVYEGRAWQVGVLLAVGLTGRTVWWELVKEALVLGAVGVALGLPLGILVGRIALPFVAETTAISMKLVAPEAALGVTLPSLGLAATLGMVAALLAASLPAWRAARLEVVQTLRTRGVEQASGQTRLGWIVRAGVVAALLVTLLVQMITRSGVLGLVSTGLIAVGTALAARPLVHLVERPVISALRVLGGPAGRFATAIITRNPRRTALTVATLGVGLGSVLWIAMLAHSLEGSVVDTLGRAMNADLIVSSMHEGAGSVEAPVDDRLLTHLAAVPGVQAVAGERAVDWHHAGGPIAIMALDPAYLRSRTFGEWTLNGDRMPDAWELVAQGRAVTVSSNFLLHIGARVGEPITLETPSGPLTLPVAGITTDFLSPRGTVKMSRELYEKLWHDGHITHAFVRVDPGADVHAVHAAIGSRLGRTYGLRILTAGQLREYFAGLVRRGFAPSAVLTVLVLLIVLAGMADTLAASVVERTREFGAIRAVGVERRHLRRMVVLEGLTLGVLGLVLAVGAGLGLGVLWVNATFPYLLGWVLELRFPWQRLIAAVAAAIGVSLAAGLLPALRASRLEPAAALRHE